MGEVLGEVELTLALADLEILSRAAAGGSNEDQIASRLAEARDTSGEWFPFKGIEEGQEQGETVSNPGEEEEEDNEVENEQVQGQECAEADVVVEESPMHNKESPMQNKVVVVQEEEPQVSSVTAAAEAAPAPVTERPEPLKEEETIFSPAEMSTSCPSRSNSSENDPASPVQESPQSSTPAPLPEPAAAPLARSFDELLNRIPRSAPVQPSIPAANRPKRGKVGNLIARFNQG